MTIVHGACPTGADAFAHGWFSLPLDDPTLTAIEEAHPADWGRYGKGAGPIRNREMVDAGADLVLAFPLPGPKSRSRGTWDCVGAAEAHGIPVEVRELDYRHRLSFADLPSLLDTVSEAVDER